MALPVRRTSSTPVAERFDPLRELDDLHARMEQLMQGVWSDTGDGSGAVWVPPVDIEETEDAWLVEAEVPGVSRKDIDIEVRDSELTIWQQVEQAYVSVNEAEERIGAAQKAVESAQENFRLFQGRFDAGVGNIIELTDAQLALTQAQSTEAQALSDYRIAIANLERSLGRR